MARPPVGELIAVVTDRGSWASWDTPPTDPPGISDAYASDLAAARSATGLDESVVTGEATLAGRRVALIAGDPRFLGGSIGVATAVRLADAIARATREGLPLLALPVGGGTRMQEGTLAFLQMAKITQAVMDHKAAGLPYLVYLRHPTMGGVFASWASLGHVTLAEPGALLGFLGPRVYEALYCRPFPSGVQLAENLEARGIVDAVVPPDQVRSAWARILQVVAREPGEGASAAASAAEPDRGPSPDPDPDDLTYTPAWTSVLATRRPDRPGVRFLLAGATDVSLTFTPVLVPTSRGILATVVAPLLEGVTQDDVDAAYDVYRDEYLVDVVRDGTWPTTAPLTGTGRALVSATVDPRAHTLVALCAIDNLGKGTAAAAVQSANIALDLPEYTAVPTIGVAP